MGTELIAAPPFGAYIACATIFLFKLAIFVHHARCLLIQFILPYAVVVEPYPVESIRQLLQCLFSHRWL